MSNNATLAAYVKTFNDAIAAFHDTVSALVAWQGSATWEALDPALGALDKLVAQHLKAIRSVRDVLVVSANLPEATHLMNSLVQDDEIPIRYASVNGTLEECSRAIKIDQITRSMIPKLLMQLRDFQYAAFMINPENHEFESYEKAIAFSNSFILIELLNKNDRSLMDNAHITAHKDFIVQHLVLTARTGEPVLEGPELATADQVQHHVTAWCEQWLRDSRGPVILGRGLHSTIGEVRARRPNHDKTHTY